jgi:predicted N-formylglutamate amidohydrolase
MHSFTPVMDGFERPWEIGILWDRDARMVRPAIEGLRAKGLTVGDNEPYSGRSTEDYSLHVHGEGRGLPSLLIEVRQDLIDTRQGAERLARTLHEVLAPLLDDPATFDPGGAPE